MKLFLTVDPELLIFSKAYGEAGVVHLVRILEREIKFGMAALGVRTVDELVPDLVSCRIIFGGITTFLLQVERVDWQPPIPKL